MRLKHLLPALAGAFVVGLSGSAGAVRHPAPQGQAGAGARGRHVARAHRDVRWYRAPRSMERAWAKFQAGTGGGFRARWDAATGVPLRLWGRGLAAPGSIASPAAAEKMARDMLAQHLGAARAGRCGSSDFVLAANNLDGGRRTVALRADASAGCRVVGGQVNFRFRNNRLVMMGSEALPFVRAGASAP